MESGNVKASLSDFVGNENYKPDLTKEIAAVPQKTSVDKSSPSRDAKGEHEMKAKVETVTVSTVNEDEGVSVPGGKNFSDDDWSPKGKSGRVVNGVYVPGDFWEYCYECQDDKKYCKPTCKVTFRDENGWEGED